MPPRDPQSFSLTRFLWRAIAWTLLAGLAWKLTLRANADFTIWLAKVLPSASGFPSPYLFCDDHPFFWHATLFPPVVGLTMASYWLRWPERIVRTVAGYVTYAGLTAVAIIINESPYLPETRFRASATSSLVNANCLMFGLVIWILSAGPWYFRRIVTSSANSRSSIAGRAWRAIRNGWGTRLGLLFLGVLVVVPAFAATGTPAGRRARFELGRAMRAVPFFPQPSRTRLDVSEESQRRRDLLTVDAVRALEKVIDQDRGDGFPAAALYHLNGHLYFSMRPERSATAETYFRIGTAMVELGAEQRSQ